MSFDIGIEGGEVITPTGRARLHVYLKDGKISEVCAERHDAVEVFDASGLFVMPGMVDAHVHFMDPGDTSREDFPTGTAAAARAGVTTVIEHTHAAPVISASDLVAKREYLRDRAVVDFGLAAHAWPDRLDEIDGVWRAGRHSSKLLRAPHTEFQPVMRRPSNGCSSALQPVELSA